MNTLRITGMLFCLLSAWSCSDNTPDTGVSDQDTLPASAAVTGSKLQTKPGSATSHQYRNIRQKIIYGNASLAEVRQALTDRDPAELTNTMHALFSMRWHRGVFKLLYDMWELKQHKYPELYWDEIRKAPVRLALASTLNRIQISDTQLFQFYIRSFKQHEHEFIRAQVVVALGFNGDPEDVPYLRNMAEGDNDYVAQGAIAGLGLMNNIEAKNALIELGKLYADTERGAIVDGILKDGYNLVRK